MVSHTRTILRTTSSYKNNTVPLDVVSLTGDICCNNSSGRELHTSSLSFTGVGLLWSNDTDTEAHTLKSWAVCVGQSGRNSVASALALSNST